MKELLLSLLTGMAVGSTFQLCKLPIPAPPVLAGIVGILGIYLGGLIIRLLQNGNIFHF